MSGLAPADVLPLLRALADAGAVLIGGQALNVWCERYRDRVPSFRTAVFTSKDVDAQADREGAKTASRLLGVKPLLPGRGDAVNSGYLQVEVDGRSIGVNLLHKPFGVDRAEAVETAIRVEYRGVTIAVLHPVLCLEGRIASLCGLDRDPAKERRQAEAAVHCAREWIRDVSDTDPEAALDLCERLFRFARSKVHAKTARRIHGVDAFDAVQPWPSLPPAFREKRYPEMRTQLYEPKPRNRKR